MVSASIDIQERTADGTLGPSEPKDTWDSVFGLWALHALVVGPSGPVDCRGVNLQMSCRTYLSLLSHVSLGKERMSYWSHVPHHCRGH